MSFLIGYRVPGDSRGRCMILDDRYHGAVTEDDANEIANALRQRHSKEPVVQSVRGGLIRLARSRQRRAS